MAPTASRLSSERRKRSCPFCGKNYSRQDAMKRHAVKCPQRDPGSLSQLSSAKGRIRHACHFCARKKLLCNGAYPCGTCRAKKIDCVQDTSLRQRTAHQAQYVEDGGGQRYEASLLCDEYDEVFSKFDFPRPVVPSSPELTKRRSSEPSDMLRSNLLIDDSTASTAGARDFVDFDFSFGLFDYELFALTGTEWAEAEELGTWLNPGEHETQVGIDTYLSTTLVSKVMDSIQSQPDPAIDRVQIQLRLEHIFLPARIARSIKLYFDGWHQNCRIIHQPSFSAADCEPALLVAMILLGAMYHPRDQERSMASSVIEHVEGYVFSALDAVWGESAGTASLSDDDTHTRLVQAAFLMVVTQFWTGTAEAKQRASGARFDRIASASRHLKLLQKTQTFDDRVSEERWLMKECQVRLTAWLVLLDCAFLFYNGLTPRFTNLEVECDLPCDEKIFSAAHPFTHPEFSFSRDWTARSAFVNLFDGAQSAAVPILTLLDTFLLIHMLYRFVTDMLLLQLSRASVKAPTAPLPYVDITSDALSALERWHSQWMSAKQRALDENAWDQCGFFKNGDQYEAAIRLLLSEKARSSWRSILTGPCQRLKLLQAMNV